MSTRDLLLMDLYQAGLDPQTRSLAARFAPVIYFDSREPFLPLAAGCTVFTASGPSPSFERSIELRPDDAPPAAMAIEYAIWWDWDIHHLYELEHAWTYLDENSQVVRVEASWHGKYYDIPVQLEGGRPVLLSEPGKHAFAPHPSWFAERAGQVRRIETRAVGVHAGVLVKEMFVGQIRQRVFDATLARSYLYQQAFQPAWDFHQRYSFPEESFVPWPALFDWIPRRVNAWLERLENNIRPTDLRALQVMSAEPTAEGLRQAARRGADAVAMSLSQQNNQLVMGGSLDLEETLQFCQEEPMGAFLEPQDGQVVERLAWLVRSNDLQQYVVLASSDPRLLSLYKSYVPEATTVLQWRGEGHDPARLAVQAAGDCGALFVSPTDVETLTPDWVEQVHESGLGIVSPPDLAADTAAALQRMGVDAVWRSPHPGDTRDPMSS